VSGVQSLPARGAIGAAAIASFFLAFALPGWWPLAAGLAFFLLPFVLRQPIGVPLALPEYVRIVTGWNPAHKVDRFARILGAACCVLMAYGAWLGAEGAMVVVYAATLGGAAALLSLRGLFTRVLAPVRDAHGVTIERETLTIDGPGGSHVIPYDRLRKVEASSSRLSLVTDSDRHIVDVLGSAEITAGIARAILAAKARAEAHAQRETTGAKELHRPSGMSVREWLGRIDALAAAGRAESAYRGPALDEEALWTLLRDEDADVEARAAAARVLGCSSPGIADGRRPSDVKGAPPDDGNGGAPTSPAPTGQKWKPVATGGR